MTEAERLASEMQRYGITTMNRWATDGAAMIRAQAHQLKQAENAKQQLAETVRTQAAEIEALKADALRTPVQLQIGSDGVWAHFRINGGYSYSQNLSALQISKRFADDYIAAMRGETP